MINKQNLWFITLFSLIMVLSIYYLTMGEDSLATFKTDNNLENETTDVVVQNDAFVALQVQEEEELVSEINKLEDVLLDNTASIEEKNQAYEDLQTINKNESVKENIKQMLKNDFKLDGVVNIEDNNIKVTISSTKHDKTLANNIIKSIQKLFDKDVYITVKFAS